MFSDSTLGVCKYFLMAVTAACLFAPVVPCPAATHYISDTLVVALREGKSLQSKAVAYLKSADSVEIIQEDGTVARVRTANGLTGWIKKKFLVDQVPKDLIIEELKRENSSLEQKITALTSTLQTRDDLFHGQANSDQISKLKNNAIHNQKVMDKAEKELTDLLQEVAAIRIRNQKITQRLQLLETLKIEAVKPELKNTARPTPQIDGKSKKTGLKRIPWPAKENLIWFLSGGVIVISAFIVGFFSRRKKAYYY